MKIAIIGAGAMGSVYAYYLSHNNDVCLIDVSKPRVDLINSDGLRILEGSEVKTAYIPAYTSSSDLDVMDLVIVFVKQLFTESALLENKQIIGKETVILSLQNGYGAWEIAHNAYPDSPILCGTSMHGATMLSDGVVNHTAKGLTSIGSPFNDYDPHPISELFNSCNIEAQVSDNILMQIWRKIIINAGINGVTALMRVKNSVLSADPYLTRISDQIVREAVRTANLSGCTFDEEEMIQIVHQTSDITGQNYSSMCQDIIGGRNTEVDSIYGAIIRLAEKYSIEVPYCQAVYNFIKAIERNKKEITFSI